MVETLVARAFHGNTTAPAIGTDGLDTAGSMTLEINTYQRGDVDKLPHPSGSNRR